MVGAAGFEPTMAVPKTAALPLGYAPMYRFEEIILKKEGCFLEMEANEVNFFKIIHL